MAESLGEQSEDVMLISEDQDEMGVIAVKKLLDELQKELSTCAGGKSESYSKIQHFIENIQKVCPVAAANVLTNTTGQSTNMEQEQDFIRPRGDSLQSRFHRERARMISGMLGTRFSYNTEHLSVLYEPYEGVLTSATPEHEVINPRQFKVKYLLRTSHCCEISPGLAIMSGLPNTQKSIITQNLLTRYVQKAPDDITNLKSFNMKAGIATYEVIAVGNKHQDLFWSEVTTHSCHNYCIASALLHDSALTGKVIRLTSTPTLGLFTDKLLDKHFQNIYDEMKKQRFLEIEGDTAVKGKNRPVDFWKRYLPGGLVVINFWDLGVDKAVLHALSALYGSFLSSYPCLFIDLERDVPDLFSPPSLSKEDFSTSDKDKHIVFRWRSRIQYLLRASLLARQKLNDPTHPQTPNKTNVQKIGLQMAELNRDESCLIIAVHNGANPDTVKRNIKLLKDTAELVAEQMGVRELIDFDFLAFDLKSDNSYRALKARLEDRITCEAIHFPISWIFLRSAFYNQDNVYIEKEQYLAMAKECQLSEDTFESFLVTFTASGSLIYAKDFEMLSKYVILKPSVFLQSLSKIFYPKDISPEHTALAEYGIVTLEMATAIFKDDVTFYMEALLSLRLAIKLETNKIDMLSASLSVGDVNTVYYMPAIRTTPPIIGCQLDALHVVVDLDVAPMSSQLAFVASVFEVFQAGGINVKLIPTREVNLLQFEVTSSQFAMPSRFQLVYQGSATEMRVFTYNASDDVCQKICDLIINTCHRSIKKHSDRYGPAKYSFAVMCSKDHDRNSSCNVKNVRHYLPERGGRDNCNTCQMSSKDTHLLKNWINALEKHPIEEAHRLHEDTLRIREMAKVAKEIEDKGLTETFAHALNEPYEPSQVKRWGGKKAALHMILNWERKRDPKEPARIEMGRILKELGQLQLASAMNLLGVIKLT